MSPGTQVKISFVGSEPKTVSLSENMTVKLESSNELAAAQACGCPADQAKGQKTMRSMNADDGSCTCEITECLDGWTLTGSGESAQCTQSQNPAPNDNQTAPGNQNNSSQDNSENQGTNDKPKLTPAQSAAKIDELKANERNMKDKEQSGVNKLMEGASMGISAESLGTWMSGAAEQRVDAQSENDMKNYLATFRCTYGGSAIHRGGEVNIELPGGNDLIPLYAEYIELAKSLSERKAALGMRPGIESQIILDKADFGLYDDESLAGISVFGSLARALMDPNSEEGQKWAQQKSDTKDKTKKAAMATLGTLGASAILNLSINSGDKKKEKSDEINAIYEKILAGLNDGLNTLPDSAQPACAPNSRGQAGNCVCNAANAVYNVNFNNCNVCAPGEIKSGQSCINPNEPTTNATSNTSDKEKSGTGGLLNQVTGSDGVLKKIVGGGDKAGATDTAAPQVAVLPASKLFDVGSSALRSDSANVIENFARSVKAQAAAYEDLLKYCINVAGHTDKTGSDTVNKKLSLERANAVKNVLVSGGIPADMINVNGVGSKECGVDGSYAPCRKVEMSLSMGACTGN